MLTVGLNLKPRVKKGFDSDAQAFFTRVTSAGGTLSATEKLATNQLVLDMKSAGIWSSMKAIYPMVGASAAACAQNLKSSSFTGTFSSGWTFASTGVTPNGTSAYMDTFFNPSIDASINSGCFGFYSRTNNGSQNMSEIGSISTNYFFMHACLLGKTYFMPNTIASSAFINFVNNDSSGFFQGFRTSATTIAAKRNSTSYSSTIAYATVNLTCYIGARHAISGGDYYSNRQCAFAYLGDSITDTQASDFYTNVQTFNTTLSRQV